MLHWIISYHPQLLTLSIHSFICSLCPDRLLIQLSRRIHFSLLLSFYLFILVKLLLLLFWLLLPHLLLLLLFLSLLLPYTYHGSLHTAQSILCHAMLGMWCVFKNPSGTIAIVKNLYWEGFTFYTVLGSSEHGNVYFGPGIPNYDIAFML